MKNIHIEGKIVNMNEYMLVIEDGSGQTFVRYSWRNLAGPVEKGNFVRASNCVAVNYSGILQLKVDRNGRIALI